ncbi:MAG: imidazolonepropionase [Clostridiales bacterium]|nr:imidazolonepropionase [Clostridiales bacterium]
MLLIKNIGMLATAEGKAPLRGRDQHEGVRIIRDAAVLINGDTIQAVYENGEAPACDNVIDAKGSLVTAGLVDAHTHLIFGGWRQHEVPLKLRGAGYLEILQAGGGILNTLTATRKASEDELYGRAAKALDEMLDHGVTTVEAKSGYGLNVEDELKQLRVIRRLNTEGGFSVVPTFMAAHAVPPEFKGDPDGYIEFICTKILPKVADDELCEFVDVFCETGVFDVEQSRKMLTYAQAYGFKAKIHADEIDAIGGSVLAGEIGAVSAEHLIAVDDAGIASMARGGTTACLLPGTSLYLGKDFAPARKFIEAGVPVAVCTDFNPGSCPSDNLQLCMNLAYLRYRMTPEEVLSAVTLNAACAIGRGETVGSVEPGKQADLVIWDAPDLDYLVYRMGSNLASVVIRKGEIVK